MPPRLNKRQQRELEELEALKAAAASTPSGDHEESSEEEEEQPGPSQRKGGGVFMNFLPAEGSEEEEEEEVKSKNKKSKKKKKKPASASTPTPASPGAEPKTDTTSPSSPQPPKVNEPSRNSTPLPPPLDKSSKKAQKKARQKEKKAAELNGSDEIDKALAELSLQYPSSQKPTSTTSTPTSHLPPLHTLLTTSLPHLDPDAEMRRFFGSRVVLASRSDSPSSTSQSNTSGRGRGQMKGVKSNLVRPGANWWPAKAREGLTLREEGEGEVKGLYTRRGWKEEHGGEKERWWTVEYSRKYLGVTKAFMGAVMSGDPQGLYDLLGVLPWHADTLLQISEIYRHREEHAQATDFTDRALFTYERAFMGAFAFTTGVNRLDFDRVENRPFFLGVHRQVADLQRRGCVRTAFEFARLLYALDPWTDPHGATLHLDFLAVKAGMHEWLLDVYDVFEHRRARSGDEEGKTDGRLNPALLPGWAYARALAMRAREEGKGEDRTASTDALKEAARDFPSIVPLLADKLDVALPAHIRAHRDFRVVTDATSLTPQESILHLLSHLYVQRSHPLWKDPALSTWFSTTITSTFPSPLPSSLPTTGRRKALLQQYTGSVGLRYSVYRHVMVLEAGLRRLFGFLPREVLDVKSLSCDPLPPPSKVSSYDTAFFSPVDSDSTSPYHSRTRTRRQQALDDRRLAQLIPDAPFRNQLRAFFDANMEAWGGRFPGGVLQFAQVVAQMPGEVLEGMLAAGLAGAGGEAGGGGGGQDQEQGAQGGAGGGMGGQGQGMPGAFGEDIMLNPDEDGVIDLGNGFRLAPIERMPADFRPPVPGPPRGGGGGGERVGVVNIQMDDLGGGGEGDFGEGWGEVEGEEGDGSDEEDGSGEEEEEDEEEEDEEDEEDISPMPRVLRNIIGRFFGRAQVEESSSDEDEAEEAEEGQGQGAVLRDDLGVD